MRQRCGASQKTTIHRHAPTCGASPKTAEERFHTLARGWLAYPVTPAAHATTAEERLQKYHRHIGIVAERRHFSVTRYAERSGCVPGFCAFFSSRVPEVRHYLWLDG